MDLDFRSVNPTACRTYLLKARGSSEAVLVDPCLDCVPGYLQLLDREKVKLTHAIDTHTHADHISGAAALRDRTGCEYVMHAKAPAPCVTVRVSDGLELDLAGVRMKVLHTPGHTKDGVCLVLGDRVLTGDTLFLDDGGAGRDDLPGGDPGEHFDSLQRILGLPASLTVFPAHDYRNRTPSDLARQKRSNPHLKSRSKSEFVTYLGDLRLGPAEWMKEVLKANYACSRDPKAAFIPTEGNACEMSAPLGRGAGESEVPGITPGELSRRLEEGPKPVLLDVRQPQELVGELGHLPGITHIPVGMLVARCGELESARDREIVTICKSGIRAHAAAQYLLQAGFPKVEVLVGGMVRWNEEGLPTQF